MAISSEGSLNFCQQAAVTDLPHLASMTQHHYSINVFGQIVVAVHAVCQQVLLHGMD